MKELRVMKAVILIAHNLKNTNLNYKIMNAEVKVPSTN